MVCVFTLPIIKLRQSTISNYIWYLHSYTEEVLSRFQRLEEVLSVAEGLKVGSLKTAAYS